MNYQGNGTYKVQLLTTSDDDFYCERGTTQSFSFTISGSATLTAPPGPLLQRRSGSSTTIGHPFSVAVNPGATGYGIFYAVNPKVLPEGGISGGEDYAEVDVDAATGKATIQFPHTGTFTLVAQAFGAAGRSPFSPAVVVQVTSPFDFADIPYLHDSRGP